MALQSITQSAQPETYTCGHCGRALGQNEPPYLYGETVVCYACSVALATPQVEYAPAAPAPRRHVRAPEYSAIIAGSIVIYAVAALLAVGAVIGIGVGIVDSIRSGPGSISEREGLVEITMGTVAAAYAALLALVGSIARAIRDIARNSFNR
ncbi:MAG TPA: hypothetical protein VFE47_12595 [Tepidisphaeraceae bacterium]|jgi:hypothetical protein|nr:hypothetical protein [Tepidisphaeraceae bacterium]